MIAHLFWNSYIFFYTKINKIEKICRIFTKRVEMDGEFVYNKKVIS